MKKIKWIQEMLQHLPEKDKVLCQKFLDKRMFVELKEIIDSDVTKLYDKLSKLAAKNNDSPSDKYTKLEEQYNQLKSLQAEVNVQAAAFIEEDNYDMESY